MSHQVFISYSRKDMDAANALCEALYGAGVDYWIDRNIHGSANFLSEITHNIRHCKVVVFIASPNSAGSPWTQKEILFALKHHKEIIPYRIGNFSFEDNDELDFIFTNIQWIESVPEVITALGALDCCGKTVIPKPAAPVKTYKVGDYYNDGVREGVVFEVSADGRHGKIVSMKQSAELQWSSDRGDSLRYIGANSKTDGTYNMAKVKARSNWRDKYPAFKWCADLGEGWYLPSIEELKTFTLNDAVHDAVNRTLSVRGCVRLRNIGELGRYWSSTEELRCRAWYVGMYSGGTYNDLKYGIDYVRAVSAF
ncbi:MAG: TIR domain-containing protein [Alistipes sp.]|nr:TIR domain-containing protein [Alistipes sp.]